MIYTMQLSNTLNYSQKRIKIETNGFYFIFLVLQILLICYFSYNERNYIMFIM